MKANALQELLSQIGISSPEDNLLRKYAKEKPPLRLELFSADQMEQFAGGLAAKHKVITGQLSEHLLKRLADNEEVLIEVHNLLTEAVIANNAIVPAGEWLLDNFYLIEEQIRTGKKHLPKGYSEVLPRLVSGPSRDLPRVYDIAIEIISHSDGRVDLQSLTQFITAYQAVSPLNLGELWAIPIMLRLALIENLRRVAARIAVDRIYQNLATFWAEQMVETAEKDPKSLILVIADMARSGPPMESAFVAELTRRLQGRGPSLALPLSWIEQRLTETGVNTLEMVYAENQKQAADQVSMSNSINSLRFLGTTDWRDFVEAQSVVERILREDIDAVYEKMDFSTRDSYRHVVERIARNSRSSEEEVAVMAIHLAREGGAGEKKDLKRSHVGYYLVGAGLRQLESMARIQSSISEKFVRWVFRYPLSIYGGLLCLLIFLLVGIAMSKAYSEGVRESLLIAVGIVALVCATQIALTLVNWMVTLIIKPGLLPRLDFSKGIPEDCRTLVVIPTMLFTQTETERLVEDLEVRYLANVNENLHFGLLTDLPDANAQTKPGDDELVDTAREGIEILNRKYGREKNDVFFLFHRPRLWNAHDRVWMGYERKRGKLGALNALIGGEGGDAFSVIVGERRLISQIRYVITLDTDTQLPRDSARQMIATMAHPLNHAVYNEKKKRVTEGSGILQPRVGVSLPGSGRSLYAKIHGNEPGIDPYTRAVSDVYQDLFGEGSFIGKGIYEVACFEKALKGRLPDNHILSHDLLEGCYARAGLISDVQLYEEYPSSYLADVKRRHRWIRGDWQIADWVLPWVPIPGRHLRKNPLSSLSRWKIFDNLRRSLVSPALMLLLILCWTVLPSAWFWTIAVIAVIMVPSMITSFWNMLNKHKEVLFWEHIKNSIQAAGSNFVQNVLTLACLPYEALYSGQAILVTNWRLLISHRRLLEWNPSGNLRRSSKGTTLAGIYTSALAICPLSALAIFFYLSIGSPITLFIAFPILALWIIAPAMVWWVSRPLAKEAVKLSQEQKAFLQKSAVRTWAYFDELVTEKDNWLPPDNIQLHPETRLAHRTSPTNMGFSLLANLAAMDFGYVTCGQFLERTQKSLSAMLSLERYRGHFYNWYDTVSLEVLRPRYVSAVDSGNLASHLLVLRQGLLALSKQKIWNGALFKGLRDTWNIVLELVAETQWTSKIQNDFISGNYPKLETLEKARFYLERLRDALAALTRQLDSKPSGEAKEWVELMENRAKNALEELSFLAPWILHPRAPARFAALMDKIGIPTLGELRDLERELWPLVNELKAAGVTEEENAWLEGFLSCIADASRRAEDRLTLTDSLAARVEDMADMDYDFLYDKSQHLLAIGFNVDDHRKDPSYYDLLASEARLGIFVSISQGKIPQEGWFALGRQLTNTGSTPVLLSWSGSMFEYLMPLLLMPAYDDTLLDQTDKSAVTAQIDYGRQRSVPWGISESGYNAVDASMNYQYKAFGVPGLGFMRGLGEELVIAPYATMLALMVNPEAAIKNLKEIANDGYTGKYGFLEAIDYTASRLPRGQSAVPIRSFMAHHQGMSLLSLAYLLLDQPMQKRFMAEPRFQASLLLLQERIPQTRVFYTHAPELANINIPVGEAEMRVIQTPHTSAPEVKLLSNGRYHVMVSNSGGGYSRWNNLAVTRWREDGTCDNWGSFSFIRDLESDVTWSSTYQPTLTRAKSYEAVYSQGRAEFRRRDQEIETHTEIVVSPEDDIEMRRIRITNHSRRTRSLEITSYAEVVLNTMVADALHPAFNNLFVQTEIVQARHAILCTRRPRSAEERPPWMFHLMKVHGVPTGEVSYETDRSKFLGRCNSIASPDAMKKRGKLSNTQGPVLDPIVSIRYSITLAPEEVATVDMVTGVGESREICDSMVEKYQDRHLADRAVELAWTHSQVMLRQINASEMDAQLYSRLAGAVIYSNAAYRADPHIIAQNRRGQSGLWSYAISGDFPIVLLQIENAANINLVRQLVQAHAYWRLKGLVVDLVIWNEDHGGYRQVLQNQIMGLIAAAIGSELTDKPGGIFVRSADQISNEDRVLFQTVARIVLSDSYGTLAEQLSRRPRWKTVTTNLVPTSAYLPDSPAPLPQYDLLFNNGIGGFSEDGKEYIITTVRDQPTPAPWSNVLANPRFGTVISESGQSYTWIENAHELRLSPWNNDPISDSGGEAYFLRDEETGHFWSPSPLPHPGPSPYLIRHGFGYSVFLHNEAHIGSEMWVYVDAEAPVKFVVIKIKNQSGKARRISCTGYVEWVLGDLRPKSAPHVVTELDPVTGALLARNSYNAEWGNRVAFYDLDEAGKTVTTDRSEFIGRNSNLGSPDAMFRTRLSGRTGAAMDPCGAMQVIMELEEGEEREIIFRLGACNDNGEASEIISKFKGRKAVTDALTRVRNYWTEHLEKIQVDTPDKPFNILANGWLKYQALSSRIMGRSGYYQSGGAFGFRDQLQDVLSLIHTDPRLVREQILLAASRQFKEGDVQHWWHPPGGRGVRTRCSDDMLWLPYVTYRYVAGSGDKELLNESVHFLEGRLLNQDEESYYDLPVRTEEKASIYNHCMRAIEHALHFGINGLPLMGSGDWNDGMDKVGYKGKGESVWLAFFLYQVLKQFGKLALIQEDPAFAKRCDEQSAFLKKQISAHAWDGEWYRRAYFDDGSPLGSSVNPECKIDSIAQSWSVLSGGGEAKRSVQSMESAYRYLVKKDSGIIALFEPPFDKSDMDPGYIKGYVPGVRENGGQYTHGAIWLIMAFASLGNEERVWELFNLINPINHGATADSIKTYKVEPYVIAADVYGGDQHKGRGGWTWYTGSAGWLYQLLIESIAGFRKESNLLYFHPCFPKEWSSIGIRYQYQETIYKIKLQKSGVPGAKIKIFVDGVKQTENHIVLLNDIKEHQVEIIL